MRGLRSSRFENTHSFTTRYSEWSNRLKPQLSSSLKILTVRLSVSLRVPTGMETLNLNLSIYHFVGTVWESEGTSYGLTGLGLRPRHSHGSSSTLVWNTLDVKGSTNPSQQNKNHQAYMLRKHLMTNCGHNIIDIAPPPPLPSYALNVRSYLCCTSWHLKYILIVCRASWHLKIVLSIV